MSQVGTIDANRPNSSCPETGGSACSAGARGRRRVNRPYRIATAALLLFCLTSCAIISQHPFVQPANDWHVRSGQLLYRTAKRTLIGDVVVRSSKNGDFELTFSKGPGVPLLVVRQDAQFADVKGAFARNGWSGPIDRAPKQLRGWLELREALLASPDRKSLRHVAGSETFLFRFN
jgi:hypothetical protein